MRARDKRRSSAHRNTGRVGTADRRRPRALRPASADAVLDREPFGARRGLWRARAGAAQPCRHGRRSRKDLCALLRANRVARSRMRRYDAASRRVRRSFGRNRAGAAARERRVVRGESLVRSLSARALLVRRNRTPHGRAVLWKSSVIASGGARRSRQSIRFARTRGHSLSAHVRCARGGSTGS